MATSVRSAALILAVLASLLCSAMCARLVGGKTEVADVKTNEEVQELGKFAVEEHNKRVRKWQEEEVKFVEVVEAQKQVVSGIKYYLKVRATQESDEAPRVFESVVVVQPWLRSKQLLHFAPSSQ
ncbi:cysteine proteinase inhibitor 4 [Lotus japonicus]|uniref:cysteine proteinase inhibitor 4 n=1 Tax=Lotus japonicus TaxID=34305 RepID=UPI00258E3174|nr:cysteine proteinase inhibitor 4 [Lotus japonicus]